MEVAEGDQLVLVQILDGRRRARLGEILRRRADMPFDLEQMALDEVRLLGWMHANRHIRLAHRQVQVAIIEQQV